MFEVGYQQAILLYLVLDVQGKYDLYQESDEEYTDCPILLHFAIIYFCHRRYLFYWFLQFLFLKTIYLLLTLCFFSNEFLFFPTRKKIPEGRKGFLSSSNNLLQVIKCPLDHQMHQILQFFTLIILPNQDNETPLEFPKTSRMNQFLNFFAGTYFPGWRKLKYFVGIFSANFSEIREICERKLIPLKQVV